MKLDMHCEMILDEYRERLPLYRKIREVVLGQLQQTLKENGMVVTGIEGRVKTEKSLSGKLELKGNKYVTKISVTDAGFPSPLSKDEDKIDNSKYWEIFDSPTDFENNCYFREGCTNVYPIPFIANFTDVKPWGE
jgi:hypothetical protein